MGIDESVMSKITRLKYLEYSLLYKILVAEAVLKGRISLVLSWVRPPPRPNAYRWALIVEAKGTQGPLLKRRRPKHARKRFS